MSVEMRIGPTGEIGPVGPTGPTGTSLSLEVAEGVYVTNGVTEGEIRAVAVHWGGVPHMLYGFELDMDESDPASMINIKIKDDKHLNVCNKYHVDPVITIESDDGDEGFKVGFPDWAESWLVSPDILIKPCILNFDGSVYKYLDPNDYNYSCTWNDDGTYTRGSQVDIDENCVGNVMVEIPTVWIKVDTTDSRKPKFYFAKTQIDSTYHAYAHTNADGDVVPYIYMAAYEGWRDSIGRLRSVSGKLPSYIADIPGFYVEPGDCSPEYMISCCRANNVSGDNIWDMTAFSERMLITLLLMLNGHSTNMQDAFGNGNTSGYQNPAEGAYDDFSTGGLVGLLPTGTMNTRGLFWAHNATNLGVKVFGIENFWGNYGKWTQGLICDNNGTLKYKLTRGTQDGSTATDYNTTGEGYLTAGAIDSVPNGGRYITDMYVGDFGLLPKSIGGDTASSSTYYCDWAYEEGVGFADFGGEFDSGCGPFCTEFHSSSNMGTITYITCKPHLNQ